MKALPLATPTPTTAGSKPVDVADNFDWRTRLKFDSPALIAELFEITAAQIQAETGRRTRIDTKATQLLTATGLSMTVAFTFGGVLLANRKAFAPSIGFTVVVFVIAIACGISAAINALRAQWVDTYFGPSKDAVFHPPLMKEGATEKEDAINLMRWRKSMIPHLWTIIERHRAADDRKARLIAWGQLCFLGFLVAVVILSFAAGVALLPRSGG